MAVTVFGGAYEVGGRMVDANGVPLSSEAEAGLRQLAKAQDQGASRIATLESKADPRTQLQAVQAELLRARQEQQQREQELVDKVRAQQEQALEKQAAEMTELREKLAAFEARAGASGGRSRS